MVWRKIAKSISPGRKYEELHVLQCMKLFVAIIVNTKLSFVEYLIPRMLFGGVMIAYLFLEHWIRFFE